MEKRKSKLQRRYQFTLLRMATIKNLWITNAGEGVGRKEPSSIVGGNVHQCSHYGKTVRSFLQNLETELLYDPVIPLLGTYLENTIIWKDTCTPLFIAAIFTITRTWKHCKCPLTEEWIKRYSKYIQWNTSQP